jgi:hypothetical protein
LRKLVKRIPVQTSAIQQTNDLLCLLVVMLLPTLMPSRLVRRVATLIDSFELDAKRVLAYNLICLRCSRLLLCLAGDCSLSEVCGMSDSLGNLIHLRVAHPYQSILLVHWLEVLVVDHGVPNRSVGSDEHRVAIAGVDHVPGLVFSSLHLGAELTEVLAQNLVI